MEMDEGFASDAEAAAFWIKGARLTETRETSYVGAAGQTQHARFYRGGDKGTLIYIHGGGWVGGSIALNDRACHAMARQSGWDVLSVSYRFAPNFPYPAGLEDCRHALRALRTRSPGCRVALGGASAGANLALALALEEEVSGLVLFYGVFGDDLETQSHREFSEGFGFSSARMRELFELYDPDRRRHTDPLICPLHADPDQLQALPPAYLLAAGLDVLRDDTLSLARRLSQLGVSHRLHTEPGVVHGFINRGRMVPAADSCLKRAAHFLSELE
jgi:acetyl esterase